MVDVFEILKQTRRFQTKNKLLESEYSIFLKYTKRKNGEVISTYNHLLGS